MTFLRAARPGIRARTLAAFLTVLVATTLPLSGWSHGELDEQLEAVTAEMARRPDEAAFYLRRAELYRERRQWHEALCDPEEAGRLGAMAASIEVARGGILLKAGRLISARRALDRAVASHPEDAEVWLLRARLFLRMEERARAAADFERAIALLGEPRPEQYLEWAGAATTDDEALGILNGAIRHLGPLISLQVKALELEQKSGRHEAALARLDTILARVARKEQWLVRRGEILEAAERRADARRAYLDGMGAIDSLSLFHRQTSATRILTRRLESGLERTSAN